jgi:hypothetical protein
MVFFFWAVTVAVDTVNRRGVVEVFLVVVSL